MQNSTPVEDRQDESADSSPMKPDARASRFWIRILPEFLRDRLTSRLSLQAIIGNSSWLFLDRILRLGVGLIVNLWVVRYLGPERYGLWNFAIAFTALFGILATLGIDGIVVRDLVHAPERVHEILGSAFLLKLSGSSLAFLLSVACIAILRHGEKQVLMIVAITAGINIAQSTTTIDLFFQSRVQSRYSVYASNSAFILMSLVKVALILMKAPLLTFVWITLAEAVLTSLLLISIYQLNNFNVIEWRARGAVMLKLMRDGWPLMLSGISIMIFMRVDQILIGQMLNDKQVGLYSAAVKISEVWYFVPMGIVSSVFPQLIKSKQHSEDLFYRRLQQLFDLLVSMAIALSVFMMFFSGQVTVLLYGRAYAGSAGVLSVLIWSGLPVAFGTAWSNWMLLENRTRTMMCYQAAGALVNLLLNLLLIPRFGIMGSAISTLISYSFPNTVLAATMKSQHRALGMLARAVFPYPRLLRMIQLQRARS